MKEIKLNNVIISYPFIVTPFKPGQRLSCTFLIEKDGNEALKKEIDSQIEIIQNKLEKNIHKNKICIYDGADESLENYDEQYKKYFVLKCSNGKQVSCFNADKSKMVGNLFYGGCITNAFIDFWYSPPGTTADSSPYPARILCNVRRVQFARDGVKLGNETNESSEGFDDVSVKSDNDSGFDDISF